MPKLRISEAQRHDPTVYFCAPSYNVPTGGIRVAYRHTDLLNEAGIPAAVLHGSRGFRCTWFENNTRVLGGREAAIGPDDLVVISELDAKLLLRLPPGYRFVVFNQGPHLSWRLSDDLVEHYGTSPDLAAILTVSRHGQELLQHAFPKAKVLRLHNSIDPHVFYSAGSARGKTIAYMPRRGQVEARQVFGILHGRRALAGWDLQPLQRLSESEIGTRLRSTCVFLSFSYQEGFGLPAAEAMASGAYVVGFHGFGGREFFRPEFSSPIEPGDTLGFAQTLERVLERESTEPGWCAARGETAARFVAREFAPEREREDVVRTYAALIGRRDGSGRQAIGADSSQDERLAVV